MEVILAAIAAACYFYGSYPLAFWLIAVAMFYTLLVLLKSISRPSWYTQQRAKAGLEEGKGFGVLLITKIAILAVLRCDPSSRACGVRPRRKSHCASLPRQNAGSVQKLCSMDADVAKAPLKCVKPWQHHAYFDSCRRNPS